MLAEEAQRQTSNEGRIEARRQEEREGESRLGEGDHGGRESKERVSKVKEGGRWDELSTGVRKEREWR